MLNNLYCPIHEHIQSDESVHSWLFQTDFTLVYWEEDRNSCARVDWDPPQYLFRH